MEQDIFDFSEALKQIKAGRLVARTGWNGKNMFIFLVPGSTFNVNRKPLLGIFPEGTEINYHAHIDMRAADGTIVPWLASQTDMLAEDWCIVEEVSKGNVSQGFTNADDFDLAVVNLVKKIKASERRVMPKDNCAHYLAYPLDEKEFELLRFLQGKDILKIGKRTGDAAWVKFNES